VTHICPGDLSDIEELVISASDDAVLYITVLGFIISSEKAACKGWERAGNVIVFELVHLPTRYEDTVVFRSYIFGWFDQFWLPCRDGIESFDEFR
jgi:hypothetical protein